MSTARTAEPSGKTAVTVTAVASTPSATFTGSTLKPIAVGTASPSVIDTLAPDTRKPSAAPDTDTDSVPSPATPSSDPAKLKLPEPLAFPAGIVTLKPSTAV